MIIKPRSHSMSAMSLYRRLQRWCHAPRPSSVRRPLPRRRLEVESLEERTLLSTYIVTSTGDSDQPGSGTLRRAILDANAHPGKDVIDFNISTDPRQTYQPIIYLDSVLPKVTDTLTIDGTSEPVWSTVQLDGTATKLAVGLALAANGCHVEGLGLSNMKDSIDVLSSNNEIDHDVIGVDAYGEPTGTGAGVSVSNVSGNQVHDNLISGNVTGVAIMGQKATGNTVKFNLIGTDGRGASALGNQVGVLVANAQGNQIIDNLISGNTDTGVKLDGAISNTLQDNLIGCDSSATQTIANGVGLTIVDGASKNAIENNTIGGNSGDGVDIGNSTGNQFVGNFIGVDKTYLHKLANAGNGVEIAAGAAGNTFSTNVMFFNGQQGVWIHDLGTKSNHLLNNGIGYNGQNGVLISGLASGNNVGAAGSGGNNISFNGAAGVAIGSTPGDAAVGNSILGNTIYGNVGLGIDLGSDGATPNVSTNPGTGANQQQNHPTLTSATLLQGALTVKGTLHSAPKKTYRIELFFALQGQGMILLGAINVTTDANGNATYAHTFANAMVQLFAKVGAQITATATDKTLNNTSEFSDPVKVEPFIIKIPGLKF
jgi:parallel beta-helix repeat protein